MSLRSDPAGPVPVGPVGPVPVGPVGLVPVGPVRFQSVQSVRFRSVRSVRFRSVLFFYMSNCRVKNAALGIWMSMDLVQPRMSILEELWT